MKSSKLSLKHLVKENRVERKRKLLHLAKKLTLEMKEIAKQEFGV